MNSSYRYYKVRYSKSNAKPKVQDEISAGNDFELRLQLDNRVQGLATMHGPNDPMQAVLRSISSAVDDGRRHFEENVKSLSDMELLRMNTIFGGAGGSSYKATLCREIIFPREMNYVVRLTSSGHMVDEIVKHASLTVLNEAFASAPGRKIDWVRAQASIMASVNARAVASVNTGAASSSVPVAASSGEVPPPYSG